MQPWSEGEMCSRNRGQIREYQLAGLRLEVVLSLECGTKLEKVCH